MDVRLKYELHKNQALIHASKARFNVIKAGRRFGKTQLALFRLVQRSFKYPGDTFWYLAPYRWQAKSIAWSFLIKTLIPAPLIRRRLETDLLIETYNGSEIRLIGCDNVESLRGNKIRAVTFDEAAYIKKEVWFDEIQPQLLGFKGDSFADFISSPNRKGSNWFTDFHADALRKQLSGDKNWASFHFTTYDNPTMTKEEVDEMRREMPEDSFEIECMAIESPYAGTLYGEFQTPQNLGEYEGKEALRMYRAIDWGIDHPTVCLWLKLDLPNKKVYVFDEYVKSGSVIMENAEKINSITGNRPMEWTVCDPSMNKRNSQTGRTDMIEFSRYGINCIPGDNRDRGIDVLKMFFKKDMIFVSPKCKNLIYQLKNLQRGQDEGDDCADALRYAVLRIHDSIHGMNVYENVSQELPYPKYSPEHLADIRKLNLNDENIFPASKNESTDWVFAEAMDY